MIPSDYERRLDLVPLVADDHYGPGPLGEDGYSDGIMIVEGSLSEIVPPPESGSPRSRASRERYAIISLMQRKCRNFLTKQKQIQKAITKRTK